jgi:tetratricopeptide (TPR) repeat protein
MPHRPPRTAISSLQSALTSSSVFYNPRLAATRYQLGVLYYQLGSYAQARGYLQTALQMPDITPELRQKIEDLLELVDKKLQPDQFFGFAQTGLRYQSNASLGRIADRTGFRRND